MSEAAPPDHPIIRDIDATASDAPGTDLAALRLQLDRLDDAVHDVLMARAGVVARIADLRAKGGVALRPGREAAIIRRLLARHTGRLPPQALVRIWREIFAATTAMQASYVVAVCDADPARGLVQLAREHFGALTPLQVHRSPAQAIGQVSNGAATVAVLPMPSENEAWWTALLQKDDPRIHVVARLPFWAPRPEGAPQAQALVVAAIAPDPTERDRTLLGLEVAGDVSRARLTTVLTAAGLPPRSILLRRGPGEQAAFALVEVDGHLSEGDAPLAALTSMLRPAVVLGAYAVPEEGTPA